MSEKYIPPVPQWLTGMMSDPAFQVEFLSAPNKEGKQHSIWKSNVGPQTWGLFCGFEEVVVGGRRGGGKSEFLIARAAMGDMSLPVDDPARYSFLNDRDFRALLLRAEYQSMSEFIEEAIEFYKHFGGKPAGDPKHIDFKSGARIYFNHLGDEEAFSKYKGWNLTFIGIEELTQITTLRRYLKLLGSLRSVERSRNGKKFPPLRTQIISTTNPDGPGREWVRERFVEVPGPGGAMIPWNTPMRDTITGTVRIFIPFPIEGNPYLAEDTPAGRRYRGMLMSQDAVTRAQWMQGSWSAGTGKFFTEYRPDGPMGDEEKTKYPWASHVIHSAPLKPWWYRWGSGDWGYDHPAAFHKFCRNEADHRVHVYDELQVRQVGSYEMGALLAKWWHADLLALKAAGQRPCITIHLGADAFSKQDVTKTKAEQMVAGIQEVLGPYGALLLKYDENEREAMRKDPKRAARMFEMRTKDLEGNICIALKPCYFDRIGAWGYCRDWLRFRPAILELQTDEQRVAYLRDVFVTEGQEAYERHAADLRNIKPEVLPKVQIWRVCRELDRCLKAAQKNTSADGDPSRDSKSEDVQKFNADQEGFGGDDSLESFRNGAVAFKEIETTMPKSYFVGERMTEAQEAHVEAFGAELTDPTRLAMIAAAQGAAFDRAHRQASGAVNIPRAGSMRHKNTVQ